MSETPQQDRAAPFQTAYSLQRDVAGNGWRVSLPGLAKIAFVEREGDQWVAWCRADLATVGHGRTRHDAAELAVQHYLIEHR